MSESSENKSGKPEDKDAAAKKPAAKAGKAAAAKKPAAKAGKAAAAKKPAAKAGKDAAAQKPAAKVGKDAAAKKPAAKVSGKAAAAKKPAAKAGKDAAAKQPAAKVSGKSAAAKVGKDAAAKKPARKEPAAAAKRGSSKKPQRILRIRLRSFDYKQIDTASDVILRTVRQTGSDIRGPIPLPVSRERYDLLRSPHVFKDSREQIEIRTYHRLIDILDPSKKTVEAMSKIELPNGVDPNMKLI